MNTLSLVCALFTLGLAAPSKREIPKYELIATHSGNAEVHLRQILIGNEGVLNTYGGWVTKWFVSDQILIPSEQPGNVKVGDDGWLFVSRDSSSTPFVIADHAALTYEGKNNFFVCPSKGFQVGISGKAECKDAVGVNLMAFSSPSSN